MDPQLQSRGQIPEYGMERYKIAIQKRISNLNHQWEKLH
jgi:hypothetical protein